MLEGSPCDGSVFCILPLSPCTLFPLSYRCSKTPNFLKMNFFRHHLFFSLPWILWTINAVDVGLDLLLHLPQCQLFLSSWGPIQHFQQLFLPSISERLSQKAGHSSPVGRESHAAFGRVALFLIYIPQQLTTLEVLVIYIYIYIYNIQSASKDSGCGLFFYRKYEEYHINLCECSMYGYC